MSWIPYLVKFLAGGALVCAFALISEVCAPKRFAGLFSAAPSVLVAGLVVTLLTTGALAGVLTSEGAVAGAVGMIAYCLAATPAIRRMKALPGACLALVAWLVVALGAYGVLAKVVGS
jgi:hypothetical protein